MGHFCAVQSAIAQIECVSLAESSRKQPVGESISSSRPLESAPLLPSKRSYFYKELTRLVGGHHLHFFWSQLAGKDPHRRDEVMRGQAEILRALWRFEEAKDSVPDQVTIHCLKMNVAVEPGNILTKMVIDIPLCVVLNSEYYRSFINL